MLAGGDRRLSRLLEAILSVASEPELDDVLQNLVEAASDLVGARYAALGVIGEDSFLSRFVHTGIDDTTVTRIGHLPEGHGILRLITEIAQPLRLDDLSSHPSSVGFPAEHPPMRSFLGTPVHVRDRVYGNLYLTEKLDGDVFTDDDEELVTALAAVAGAAIANAELFDEVQRLHLVDERERIGRDLHDTVIQRLFATGLTLGSTARRLETIDLAAASSVGEAVDELDATVRQIRQVIFSLQAESSPSGARRRLVGVARDAARTLGFTPTLTIEGPLDLLAGDDLTNELVAVLGEALTNVAKHASANSVTVAVVATAEIVTLRVIDDGVGLPEGADRGAGLGLANLARRADRLGGTFEVSATGDGTTLVWSAPT